MKPQPLEMIYEEIYQKLFLLRAADGYLMCHNLFHWMFFIHLASSEIVRRLFISVLRADV